MLHFPSLRTLRAGRMDALPQIFRVSPGLTSHQPATLVGGGMTRELRPHGPLHLREHTLHRSIKRHTVPGSTLFTLLVVLLREPCPAMSIAAPPAIRSWSFICALTRVRQLPKT